MIKKEILVARIISGILRCCIYDKKNIKHVFIVKSPTPELKYEAEEIYEDAYQQAFDDNILTRESMVEWMSNNGFWDKDKQLLFDELPNKIEEAKIRLFDLSYKTEERKKVRKELRFIEKKYEEILSDRFHFDSNTCEGFATLVKNNFIISNTLYKDGKKIEYATEDLLNEIGLFISHNRITEKDYRELARTEPWRSIWSIGKEECFGIPTSCFSDEQKNLVLWTKMYDNIYEHSERPNDDIIEDDDLLDGWLLKQRHKRKQESITKESESLISDKMRKADEIYVVVDNYEDAKKIDAMNTTMSKIIKAQRNNMIKNRGEVLEQELPDRVQAINMAAAKMGG